MSSTRRGNRLALLKAFDNFMADAFGSESSITSGGRLKTKTNAGKQTGTKERICMAKGSSNEPAPQKSCHQEDDNGNDHTNYLHDPDFDRKQHQRQHQRALNGDDICQHRQSHHHNQGRPNGKHVTSAKSAVQMYHYFDDPEVSFALPTHRRANVKRVGLTSSVSREAVIKSKQVKIDSGNRLLRPTVGFAAKHVNAVNIIENMDGEASNDQQTDAVGVTKPKVIKKAFRHLHEALTGNNGHGVNTARVNVVEFQRKNMEREAQRRAKLDALRQLQEEEEAEVS